MARGGNAVDAAVALNAVLSVVAPDTCGPGGDLFALVYETGAKTPSTLNGSGRAGSLADAQALRDSGFEEMPTRHPATITVPGCVDGWSALLAKHGQFDLGAVLTPAITLAAEGFAVSGELSWSLDAYRDMVADQPSAHELYPGDVTPEPGSTMRRPALARTLEELVADGRDAFYLGAPGRGIIDASAGAITLDDLGVNQADWIDPVSLELFGRTAWTIPPNSQGYLTLAALWIFEQLGPPRDPHHPQYQHLLIEAYRSVAFERSELVSDAKTAPLSMDELVASERLLERVNRIDPSQAGEWDPSQPGPGGTAYMCTSDADGMGVSLIQSNYMGIGSGISAGNTGVWCHNRGGGFNLMPGHHNELEPGRRPLHTLSPTLWTRGTDLDMILGTRGGDQQPQYLIQAAANHYYGALSGDDSQTFPRWNMDQPHRGGQPPVGYESRFSTSTIEGLVDRGHVMAPANDWMSGWGPISIIDRSGPSKGSADPRISTSAALASEPSPRGDTRA